jgi:hypothetical protein
MSRGRVTALALAAGLVAVTCATASWAFDPITWRTVDGGGVSASGGGAYSLGGTIGQHDAGVMGSGAWSLRGGFWRGGATAAVGVAGDLPAVRPFRLYPTRPNPVRSASRVAFDLPRSSRVTLALFDVAGRAVRAWDYGVLPAGHEERVWNAVDESGRAMRSGVYFLRLEAGRDRGVSKVLVVR